VTNLGGHPSPERVVPLPVVPGGPAPGESSDWQASSLRQLVLADRKAVKLDRAVLLQILAQRDTPEQVVADLVAMFTETGE
jgi:hypothetical protein